MLQSKENSLKIEEQKIEEEEENKNDEDNIYNQNQQKPLKFITNFFFIFFIATSWALASQFRKSVMIIDQKHIFAPYFMVWFSTSFMFFCYPFFIIYFICKNNKKLLKKEHLKAIQIFNYQKQIKKGIRNLIILLILWTISNYTYAYSLSLISASIATSIMSTNTAIVYILEWLLLNECFSIIKTIATLFAIIGVIIISLNSEFSNNNFIGIIFVILSALFAAFYKVLFKKFHKNASLSQISIFMSTLGLTNLFLNGIITFIFLFINIEYLNWKYIPWLELLISSLLILLFNSLVNFGIVILSPLTISIGMIFGIPLSAIIDLLFRSLPSSFSFFLGSIFILISFILIALPQIEQKFKCAFKSKNEFICINFIKKQEEEN
ncbi:EamA domain-containing protein [Meloidogyne graminicola]|uniref:EamA domain-containing protein n=1 Tax=Meloidogyne graminicola TaxID=189291 RepID=A0A8S9ZIL5_9BILA|nr:EamA domain-containing protein [Meloidogyne graminicola]